MRASSRHQQGAAVADMRNFRAFLDRLDEAVLQQQTDVGLLARPDRRGVGAVAIRAALLTYNTIAARRETARQVQARRRSSRTDSPRSSWRALAFGD